MNHGGGPGAIQLGAPQPQYSSQIRVKIREPPKQKVAPLLVYLASKPEKGALTHPHELVDVGTGICTATETGKCDLRHVATWHPAPGTWGRAAAQCSA